MKIFFPQLKPLKFNDSVNDIRSKTQQKTWKIGSSSKDLTGDRYFYLGEKSLCHVLLEFYPHWVSKVNTTYKLTIGIYIVLHSLKIIWSVICFELSTVNSIIQHILLTFASCKLRVFEKVCEPVIIHYEETKVCTLIISACFLKNEQIWQNWFY